MAHAKVKIGQTDMGVDVADSFFKKAKGLMFRRSLGKNKGMLFIFNSEARWGIVMFGMRFPIDIIWVGKNMRVVDIVEGARPCLLFCRTYRPKKKAKYVLEVNSGFVKRHRIKLGSRLKF